MNTASIISFSGKAFGVLVSKGRAHSLHDRTGNKIFRCNHLEAIVLALDFVLDDVEDALFSALDIGDLFFANIRQNQVDETGLALLQSLALQGEDAVGLEVACEHDDLALLRAKLDGVRQEVRQTLAKSMCV